MPMDKFLYYAKSIGLTGRIDSPEPHVIDNLALTELPNHQPGHFQGDYGTYRIDRILSIDRCSTSVSGVPENQGVFHTEVTATVENLRIFDYETGEVVVSADRIVTGIQSIYRRSWYRNGDPASHRIRILPVGCEFTNLYVKGHSSGEFQLPAPFQYTPAQRAAYFASNPPDPAVEAQIAEAINSSASRFVYVPNFGRIFFGQWELRNVGQPGPVHGITMLRLNLGSPVVGALAFGDGSGDGGPTGG